MSPRVTRRRALTVAGAATAATAASLFAWRRDFAGAWLDRREVRLAALTDDPPGVLDPDVARVLSAAAEGLVGLSLERTHYEGFYTWRAEHLPGYRALYVALASAILAGDDDGPAFVELDPAARQARLRDVPGAFDPPRWSDVLLHPLAPRIGRHFVDETIRLFDATDAWIILGYDGWPGMARGLDAYRQPLPARPALGGA